MPRLRNSILLCAVLGGCAIGPDYQPPENVLPDQFLAAPAVPQQEGRSAVDAAQWWKSLGDEKLNTLIDRALINNPQLDIALTRLQEARQQEAVVLGGALPNANLSAGGGRGTGSDLTRGRADASLRGGVNGKAAEVYGFAAGWELDLFGKYRRQIEAAGAQTQAMAAARNDVLISIIADVVRAYTNLRGIQMQQAVLTKHVASIQQYVDVAQKRYDLGITNELDLRLAERQLSTLQAQAAPLNASAQAATATIALLLGEFPENLSVELQQAGTIPALPDTLSTGVPVDLLRTRPDIQQAERELAAATARIGVAEANLFPHITLLGGAGVQSAHLGGGSPQSFIWSVGPSIGAPILDFGALDALVNIADLQTHEMLVRYKQTVLTAVSDVDTASSAYSGQQQRLKELNNALTASQQALTLAQERYDRGLTDMLNVIDAQRQQFELEQEYITAEQASAEQFVALYKALGSGWQSYQTIPPIRSPQPALIAAITKTLGK